MMTIRLSLISRLRQRIVRTRSKELGIKKRWTHRFAGSVDASKERRGISIRGGSARQSSIYRLLSTLCAPRSSFQMCNGTTKRVSMYSTTKEPNRGNVGGHGEGARSEETEEGTSSSSSSTNSSKTPRRKPGEFEIFTYDEDKVFVLGHYRGGFKVNNTSWDGAIMMLPNLCLKWAVYDLNDVTTDSALLGQLIHPAPEVFILGTGAQGIPPLDRVGNAHENLREIRDALLKQGTQLEILDSVGACATFNVLNAENRRVAGAFLPIVPTDG